MMMLAHILRWQPANCPNMFGFGFSAGFQLGPLCTPASCLRWRRCNDERKIDMHVISDKRPVDSGRWTEDAVQPLALDELYPHTCTPSHAYAAYISIMPFMSKCRELWPAAKINFSVAMRRVKAKPNRRSPLEVIEICILLKN